MVLTSMKVQEIRFGVEIKVVYEPATGKVVMPYPPR